MSRYSLLKLWVAGAATSLLIFQSTVATPVTIFKDDFQTDTAGTGNVGGDLDPVIDTGAGDIGSWTIREGSTGNNFVSGLQVYNDTVPANGIAGTNNYLRNYRGGGPAASGKPYATGWVTADTTNRLVQLDMSVWQEQLTNSVGAALMNVMFGGAPQNNPSQATWLNSVSVWVQLTDTNVPAGGTGAPPQYDFPDNQWLPIRILANFSSTDTQAGLAPQTFSTRINNGTPTTNNFNTAKTTVQSILVAWEGINEHFDYIDDLTIQLISDTLTVKIDTLPDQNQQLTFTGYPGSSFVVQASTNLTDWVSLSTNTLSSIGQFIYSDLAATNHSDRFYRGLKQ